MARDKVKQREYQKKWYEKNQEIYKEKAKEYRRKYNETHREEVRERNREWARKNREKLKEKHREFMQSERGKEYRQEYYRKNKDYIYRKQQEYMAKNRKKVTKMMLECRKRNAEKYAAEGQMFCYLHRTERENKMVEKLSKEFNISKEKSREILESRNWNIKSLIEYDYKIYDKDINLIEICHSVDELAEYFNVSHSTMQHYLNKRKQEPIIKRRNKIKKEWCYIVKEREAL